MPRSLHIVILSILLLSIGCEHRPAAIMHTRTPRGTPLRLELDAENEDDDAPVDPQLRQRRMQEYRAKAATRPIAALVSLQPTQPNTFDPFIARDCPPEGTATSHHNQDQNTLKNRTQTPQPADFDNSVTLAKMMKSSSDDTTRFSTGRAVTIIGYLKSAKATGAESCNCGEKDEDLTDTHMDIVNSALDFRKPVIAEITPVWRLMHQHNGLEDWSSAAIRAKYEGHRVKITGWLFFDDFHKNEADNTDPGDHKGKKNWRRTCWEIHPVTSIELMP